MKAVITLSVLAIKEYLRRKIWMITFLMLLVVTGTGLIANPFTMGLQSRLMRDLALLFIQLFSILFSLALSATTLPNEVEKKTVYPYLGCPISRGEYLWGKFTAVSLLTLFNDAVLAADLFVTVRVSAGEIHRMIFTACFLIFVESAAVAAFALWFSTFMTPPVTLAAALLLYVVGNLSHVYTVSLTSGNAVMREILLRVKSLLPYFDYFSIRSAVVHNHPVSFLYIFASTLYGILYVVLVMLFAEWTLLRKDL